MMREREIITACQAADASSLMVFDGDEGVRRFRIERHDQQTILVVGENSYVTDTHLASRYDVSAYGVHEQVENDAEVFDHITSQESYQQWKLGLVAVDAVRLQASQTPHVPFEKTLQLSGADTFMSTVLPLDVQLLVGEKKMPLHESWHHKKTSRGYIAQRALKIGLSDYIRGHYENIGVESPAVQVSMHGVLDPYYPDIDAAVDTWSDDYTKTTDIVDWEAIQRRVERNYGLENRTSREIILRQAQPYASILQQVHRSLGGGSIGYTISADEDGGLQHEFWHIAPASLPERIGSGSSLRASLESAKTFGNNS